MKKILIFIILFYFHTAFAQESARAIDSIINNTKKRHLLILKDKSRTKTGYKNKIHIIDTTYFFDKRSKFPVAIMIDNWVSDSASTTVFRFYEGQLIRYHHDYMFQSGYGGYQNYYFSKQVLIDEKVLNPKPVRLEQILSEANQLYLKAQIKLSQNP